MFMEDNKEKKENKSLWKKIRDAGYGFIPMVIVSTICIGWMHYCEGGYYLVKKEHCVAVDDSIMKYSYNVSIKQDSDSVCNNFVTQNRHFLTQQEPADVSKGSYLSLWAATLAVIFVVFSIFGVLKLEITKGEIDKKLDDLKDLKEEGQTQIKELKKLVKQSQEDANKSKSELEKLNKKSQQDNNELVKRSNELQEYGALLHRMSIHFMASENDNKYTRKRRIEEVSQIMDKLRSKDLNIDNYELLKGIFLMCPIKGCKEEVGDRMELIITCLNKDNLTIEKLILLGKSYYRLYTSSGPNNKDKQDRLKMSISVYCAILQTSSKDIIDDELTKMMELPKRILSNVIQLSSEKENEINDILYEFSKALYDYALNYCDEDLKQVVLKKASNILNKLTK